MARILVLTTDLPFFPGRNGHDFFNLRHLASVHEVGMVGPYYEHMPAAGVANLEAFLAGSYFWPRPSVQTPLFIANESGGGLQRWVLRLPETWRRGWMRRLLGIADAPQDSLERLAIFSNFAPNLLQAIFEQRWHLFVLIQSNTEPWLKYLPSLQGRLLYFHDIRSHYLRQLPAGPSRLNDREITAIARQEQLAANSVDLVGFVSQLDADRATSFLPRERQRGVARIPVDIDYYYARKPASRPPVALFTGHLGHAPNDDAVRFFLDEIWPLVRQDHPAAQFIVAGMAPTQELQDFVKAAPGAELYPNVPDIRPFFEQAVVYIVPMRFGGGVRQKLFEAWSIRVPVVTTSMGAEGISAMPNQLCRIADTPNQFAAAIDELFKNKTEPAFVERAHSFVRKHHSITAAAPEFEQLVDRALLIRRQRPYRILLDLRWMEIGRAGGSEQMTHELISSLSCFDHQNEFRLYGPRDTLSEIKLFAGFKHRKIYCDELAQREEACHAQLTNELCLSLDEQQILTTPMRSLRAYNDMDFDLVHSLCGYIHPDLEAFPQILTVHDLQHIHYPEFFGAEEWRERETLYRRSIEKAKHLICISEFTRQDVHRHYGVPWNKMTTIWNTPTRSMWKRLSEEQSRQVVERMGVFGRFLFYPAHNWPHKNHLRLVETVELIEPHLPANMQLIFTGRQFALHHPAAIKIRELGMENRIVHLGYRSPLEIRALMQKAEVLVVPSLFEGFGMPVAEAIISGTPVACSNVTSLPEIAGDAALTFDPLDIHSIGGTLLRIINDPAEQDRLRQAALNRRNLFSSRENSVRTLALYQRVYDEIFA